MLFPISIVGQSQDHIDVKQFCEDRVAARICIEKSVSEASSIYETYMEYLSKEIKQEIDGYSIDMFRPPKSQIVGSKTGKAHI